MSEPNFAVEHELYDSIGDGFRLVRVEKFDKWNHEREKYFSCEYDYTELRYVTTDFKVIELPILESPTKSAIDRLISQLKEIRGLCPDNRKDNEEAEYRRNSGAAANWLLDNLERTTDEEIEKRTKEQLDEIRQYRKDNALDKE